jgi:hypothetical protein
LHDKLAGIEVRGERSLVDLFVGHGVPQGFNTLCE